MESSFFEWEGGELGGTIVPAFEVVPGDLIQLRIDSWPAIEAVADALLSTARTRGKELDRLEIPHTRSWFREFLHRERAAEWVCRRSGCSKTAAAEHLRRFDVDPDMQLCCLAGNPRMLMALAAAHHSEIDGILFTTVGMDPLGIKRFVTEVAAETARCPAIQLTQDGHRQLCANLGLDGSYTKVIDCEIIDESLIPATNTPSIREIIEGY